MFTKPHKTDSFHLHILKQKKQNIDLIFCFLYLLMITEL